MSRLPEGGLLDRSLQIPFRFDGRVLLGYRGDSLASALIANDVKLVGRSFKYHRPRGILSAGSEEPNALLTLGEGAARTPNIRATMTELHRGLAAQSQNRFPALAFDLLAVNDLLAPFLGAGFYYKTFMWPPAFWERLYEPLIRRAAGLGALDRLPDTNRYEKAFAHCDLLVIGAGPAGLMAALVAAGGGLDVILADEDFRMGGRLNAESHEVDGRPGAEWAAQCVARLEALDNVRLMPRTTVTGAYDGGTWGALERAAPGAGDAGRAPLETFWRIVAKRAVLATGATERPIAFADNDRPGVMLAGAVRGYVNRFAAVPGKAVSIFTNNDDGHRTAADLRARGIEVACVIDTRPDPRPRPGADYPLLTGAVVTGTRGRMGINTISLRTPGGQRRIATDCLAVSGGWNPNLHLSCHLGARPVWRPDIAAFVPAPGAIPGVLPAGAVAGVFSTHGALKGGAAAARQVLKDLGRKPGRTPLPKAEDAPVALTAFWHVEGGGRAWLDFQNDVTTRDVKQAHRENFRSVEHMKRYTTLGMAADQGRTANVGALAIMAGLTGRSIGETGTTTFRPPYTPVSMGALGAHGAGKGFAPERLIPSHGQCLARRAPMLEAGLWHRPAWFPRAGEHHWRQSCDREVTMVREHVGICDVSTLGKIDLQGADAAEFLDRVYCNMISTLAVGRVRYGLMLREDGMVMDDGTVARLGRNRFLLTTTTAAAGQVMTHLHFAAQVLWPQLDVQFVSVTDHWAQFAVAGPKSRSLLEDLCARPLPDDILPFMGHAEVRIGKVGARLFRISFSGELGFEIAVPARFGAALGRELTRRAEALGGGLYGMEALNVLRLEKGFVTHAEIDGRVTADDIGMGRMVSERKDCIGKAMSRREGLRAPGRQQLVGLKPAGEVKRLLGGAHLFDEGDPPTRENDRGHVTSQGFSPTLGHPIALALVSNGRARIGERIRMVDGLRDVSTLCEICAPVFFDPEGGRMRG